MAKFTRRAGVYILSLLAVLPLSCGGDKAGLGESCNRDADCRDGLVCKNNICTIPEVGECDPPCKPYEICVEGKCQPVDHTTDKDGDGWPYTLDCDDLDPFTYPEDFENGMPGGFEYCDGKDNDCDGLTDEGCRPCRDGDTQECGTDIGECTLGIQTCVDGEWGPCSGQPPAPEVPDGLDNDCDGATDEGLACSAPDVRACGTDVGECSPGQQHCEDGKWTDCRGGVLPAAELCDGKDNNCNGLIDDGFMIGQICDGIGECGRGVYECSGDYQFRCSTEAGGSASESQPELCNGLDDDCDGETDEDFLVGQLCNGTGMCAAGQYECFSLHASGCSSDPGGSQDMSRPEVCDNLDNDCDGITDQDEDSRRDCRENRPQPNALLQDCVAGRCLWQCQPGWIDRNQDLGVGGGDGCEYPCTPTDPPDEICDGRDNDCNGLIDDGDDESLCAPLSAQVIRGTCNRNSGNCLVANPWTDCEPGWWDLDREWSNGCEVELDRVPDTCAAAKALPEVSDHGGTNRVIVSGNLVPAGDEDWYKIVGVDNFDDDERISLCDSYHIKMKFNTRAEGVVFDVAMDSCAMSVCTRDTEFEHYTNFTSGTGANRRGECPCKLTNTTGFNICSKKDRTFFIRVYRLAGYSITADSYELEISNGI